jgi:energy-coupling factor transporter transmembrane protein EcfT
MVALVALLLILAIFGGLGFAAHFLWIVLVAALILWVLGFFIGSVEGGLVGGRRRWYGR